MYLYVVRRAPCVCVYVCSVTDPTRVTSEQSMFKVRGSRVLLTTFDCAATAEQ